MEMVVTHGGHDTLTAATYQWFALFLTYRDADTTSLPITLEENIAEEYRHQQLCNSMAMFGHISCIRPLHAPPDYICKVDIKLKNMKMGYMQCHCKRF